MDKTLKYILIAVIVIAAAWFLSGFLFGNGQTDEQILTEVDLLDTELNTEVVQGRQNPARDTQLRKRIMELLEKLRKRGKKICRNNDGTLFIQDINLPCGTNYTM